MLLRPRKFKRKNITKRRRLRFFKKSILAYGQIGLVLLQPLRLNSKQIFRYKLFFKKASKRSDKTLRKAWFKLFPHLPISRKVFGSRMGKGKGKLDGWGTELPAGIFIVELKNLRTARAKYFLKQLMLKLPAKARISGLLRRSVRFATFKHKYVEANVIW